MQDMEEEESPSFQGSVLKNPYSHSIAFIANSLKADPLSGRADSPARQNIEEAARIAGLDFILNVVINSKKEIVAAVAGDFIEAHRKGAEIC